ncbi:MAG: GIY-YIG nuclease family protein [Deltaproteobacteria bacterium]|nr:MAG: GIY-YIG nuclease family protein [Deltaproteobacteria bacterium]
MKVVYFLRGADALKIGWASDIVKRFEGVQAQSPVKLELVGLIHGGVNVERWCHFHCIDHRLHYEWFRWNTWTDSFVRWVLAHGDDAAVKLCERHLCADGLLRQTPVYSGFVHPLPQMKFRGDVKRLEMYKRLTERNVVPLGACSCTLCGSRPWEGWQ